MIAKGITTIGLLLLFTAAALAQVQAVGPTVTLTPDARFGSNCFCPGAYIRATGRIFDSTPTSFSPYQVSITLVPSERRLRPPQVGVDHLLFQLLDIFAQPVDMTGVTGIRIVGFGINEVVPLTGSATPVPAAPVITTQGHYNSSESPGLGVAFDGVINFGSSSIIQVILFGSGFGNISTWIVRFSGTDAAGNPMIVDVRAQAHPFGEEQSLGPFLRFLLGRSPVGPVQVQARAADNPALQSNTITLQIP